MTQHSDLMGTYKNKNVAHNFCDYILLPGSSFFTRDVHKELRRKKRINRQLIPKT